MWNAKRKWNGNGKALQKIKHFCRVVSHYIFIHDTANNDTTITQLVRVKTKFLWIIFFYVKREKRKLNENGKAVKVQSIIAI